MGSRTAGWLELLLVLWGIAMISATRHDLLRASPLLGPESLQEPLSANSIFSSCDFDQPDRPFCDWTQPQDGGSPWLRGLGQKPGASPGPPEGDLSRRDHYIYPEAGEEAQLESPDLDPTAPAEICVQFLYYLYSVSRPAQLAVEIRGASGNVTTLWARSGPQSSSWLNGAVTVPAQAWGPFKVVFRASQSSTTGIELAVDSILIQLGPCSPCVTKCNFDNPGDLCGWEDQSEDDVAWEPWSGQGEVPGVGPTDDFSRPGLGSYMLLSAQSPESRGTALLRSPTFASPGGCLALSLHYTLHGVSSDTALQLYAAEAGGDLGASLLNLSGEHGPHWKPAAAHYTGKGNVQFVIAGTFRGQPGLAVDSVAIAPCEEVFAACDFNEDADPFCGWLQPEDNGTRWIRTNRSTPTEDTGPSGDYPHGEGYYIFAEGGLLRPGQALRLSSRPFCVNGPACVEFRYHMHSVVRVKTELRVLLEGPSGTAVLLWNRTGSQGSDWLSGSVMVPYGGAQPSQVTFEVVRGRNAFLDVALDNISVRRHPCAEAPGPSSTAASTPAGPNMTGPPEQATDSQPAIGTPSGTTATSTTSRGPAIPQTPDTIVTKPSTTTMTSTPFSSQESSTSQRATAATILSSSTSPGLGDQSTPGLPSTTQRATQTSPAHALISTQSSTTPDHPQLHSTSRTSPSSGTQWDPTSTSLVTNATTPAPLKSTSQVIIVPTGNESQATPPVPPSNSSPTTDGGDPGQHSPSPASSTSPPCPSWSTTSGHPSSTLVTTRPHTAPPGSVGSSSPTTNGDNSGPHSPSPASSTSPPGPSWSTTSGHPSSTLVTTRPHTAPPGSVDSSSPTTNGDDSGPHSPSPASSTSPPGPSWSTTAGHFSSTLVTTRPHTAPPGSVGSSSPTTNEDNSGPHSPSPASSTSPPGPSWSTTAGHFSSTLVTTRPHTAPPGSVESSSPTTNGDDSGPHSPSPASSTSPPGPSWSTTSGHPSSTLVTTRPHTAPPGSVESSSPTTNGDDSGPHSPSPASSTSPPGPSWSTTSGHPSSTLVTTRPHTAPPGSVGSSSPTTNGDNSGPHSPSPASSTSPPGPSWSTTSGHPSSTLVTTRPHTAPPGSVESSSPTTNGDDSGPHSPSPASSTSPPGPSWSTTSGHPSSTLVTTRPHTAPPGSVESSSPTTNGDDSGPHSPSPASSTSPPGPSWSTTSGHPSSTLVTTRPHTAPPGSVESSSPTTNGDDSGPHSPSPASSTSPPGPSWSTTSGHPSSTLVTTRPHTAPPGSVESSSPTTNGDDSGPHSPSPASSTSPPGPSWSTTSGHPSSTLVTTRPHTAPPGSVESSSPTTNGFTHSSTSVWTTSQPGLASSGPNTATLPDITVSKTAIPNLTTTLKASTGVSGQSQPSTLVSTPPSYTFSSSSQHPGPTLPGPSPTGAISTSRSTSTSLGFNQTSPTTAVGPGQRPDRAICTASGDPHYTTYDGRLFHFMGNCTYLLSAACNASPGQPTFQVQAANEHRGGNTQVSYIRSVSVSVHGNQIVLLKARRVMVNGQRVTLPVSVAGGQVSVRLSGLFVLLQTDFGLWVRFDGNHHAEVSVPPSYLGKLCGLCGNYNGDAADDNLMPNGTSAGADVDRLGESWQVPGAGEPGCSNGGDFGECNPDVAAEALKPTGCGILFDPQGPFAPCLGQVPPAGAFENCFYDLCGTGGEAASLCFALQSYADRCAQAGISIAWRNSTFCPLNCPAGSSYTPCGPACPATCTDPDSPDSCPNRPCVEGCRCNQGLVLSGEQCVQLSQCGCTDSSGQYHGIGESWMGDQNCTQRCSCAAGNQITCESWSCTPVQECRPVEGLLGCQDTGVATCHVAGDPHYFTFDGKMVSFMGTCTYTLVTLCQHDPHLPAFNVTAKNEERGQPEASYLRHVTIQLAAATITLQKGRRVLIDGQRVRTPVEGRIPGVSITSRGIYVVLETDFGLVVKFDGNHHLEIQLPGTYFDKVCGMCGNFNNQSADDLQMPNRHLAANDSQFGNSWRASGDADPGCQPDDRVDLNPNCSRQDLERLRGLCLEIMAPKYQPCHSVIDPKLFFQNCLYDLCEYQGMASVLCDNLQAYVEACKSQGMAGLSWRNATFCPLPCPPNSHFTECASPCPATCSNLYAPAGCRHLVACVEGCACDRGHVLSDDTCVPVGACGCLDHQREYHSPGDTWVTSNCLQRCTCLGGGQIRCQPFRCLPGSRCQLSAGGLRYCRPTAFHQCVISGDPHYRTFDNFVHHFQGRFTYTLTRTLSQAPDGLEPLSVAGRNRRRSLLHRVSFLREVYVEVLGYRITLMQGRKMAVNGVRVNPPYSPREGLQITLRGRSLLVQSDFGFSVSFNGRNLAEITLPSTYQQHVGGLCGNYDGRRNNEFMKPDGTWTRLLNAFGNSWQVSVPREVSDRKREGLSPARVRREEPDQEPESGFEMDCTPEQLAFVNGTTVCGRLSAPQGPFSACHGILSPVPFQESCVYDLCALFNDSELLCEDFEAYALLCQEEGVELGLWRQETSCGVHCPAHTSYQPCMSACPASCTHLAAPSDCVAPCVEGCACDPGHVLSGLLSVPYNQCGCSRDGRYYEINQTFLTEDCSQRCTCHSTAVLECRPAGCPEGQVCAVANYTRGCFQESPCLSSPCQNEGTCQDAPGGFLCLCLGDYGGVYCEEALPDTPATTPPWAATSSSSQTLPGATLSPPSEEELPLAAILLGVFIPLGILLLAAIAICVCQRRKRKKMEDDLLAVLSASGPIDSLDSGGSKVTPF